ncbi:trypsin eta-like [Trichogramma pretiosum]|uniref:trypsin eta-like n=1 Tax=Trichogramma pretiosum TaxID=7493 RepID=UPI0006C95BA4|nr:trypsin eta-like [Trichogramma pretiosum]
MLKTSLSSLLFGLLLIIAVSNVSAKIKQRIIGGSRADGKRFKYQVSLQLLSSDGCSYHWCGGSILDEYHIITAAHCVTDKYTHKFNNLEFTVVAGTDDLKDKTRKPGIYRDVEYIYMPEAYEKTRKLIHDIAILRLRNPLPLHTDGRISAIKLPTANQYQPPYSPPAVMSGFGAWKQTLVNGKLIDSGSTPFLQFVYGYINKFDPKFVCESTVVCVQGVTPGVLSGTCFGDSGGPLVDYFTNTLIGVTSGSDYDQCGITTRFTRVSSYLKFIEDVRSLQFRTATSGIQFKHVHELIFPTLPLCN